MWLRRSKLVKTYSEIRFLSLLFSRWCTYLFYPSPPVPQRSLWTAGGPAPLTLPRPAPRQTTTSSSAASTTCAPASLGGTRATFRCLQKVSRVLWLAAFPCWINALRLPDERPHVNRPTRSTCGPWFLYEAPSISRGRNESAPRATYRVGLGSVHLGCDASS